MAELTGGTLIDDRYELVERIGEGTFGEVWKAQDRKISSRNVALKWLKLEHAGSAELVDRFEREADALGKLQHPCVVSVFDRGTWSKSSYIVMEYVPGETLRAWLERLRQAGRAPALDVVRGLFDDIC